MLMKAKGEGRRAQCLNVSVLCSGFRIQGSKLKRVILLTAYYSPLNAHRSPLLKSIRVPDIHIAVIKVFSGHTPDKCII